MRKNKNNLAYSKWSKKEQAKEFWSKKQWMSEDDLNLND